MTAVEVAELLGISKRTFYRHRAKMHLQTARVGRSVRYGRASVEEYLAKISYRE